MASSELGTIAEVLHARFPNMSVSETIMLAEKVLQALRNLHNTPGQVQGSPVGGPPTEKGSQS